MESLQKEVSEEYELVGGAHGRVVMEFENDDDVTEMMDHISFKSAR